MKSVKIHPQPNEYSDHFLDVVGNEFKFDHAKGLAEWMKNSADAYATTAKVRDSEQHVLLRFLQGKPKRESVFECIDFVGMTKRDIDKALKVWGLPTAAKKGTKTATYGGHGNGGKFYMRQMFETSTFVTFRGGLLNVFGFDKRKRYGYAQGFEDKKITLAEALKFAEIDELEIPPAVLRRWKKNPSQAGFTVARGMQPHKFSGRATVQTILERLRVHPQARRLLAHKQVCVLARGDARGRKLEPPSITPRKGYETPRFIELPRSFEHNGQTLEFRDKKHPHARLVLRTSETPLARSGELAALNTIDILGEIGCIGSYRMNELGFLKHAQESEFIYGECECPMLEDPKFDCVKNDREKLIPNDLSNALIEWIRQQVDSLAGAMSDDLRLRKKTHDLRQSALFNQLLDRWKNRFMVKLTSDLFGGPGMGGSFGGTGAGADAKAPRGNTVSEDDGKNTGDEGEGGGGAGDEKRRGPRFPRVLLSDQDVDPLDEEAIAPFHVDERQPPVYQRPIDVEQGIYWINTARPLASKILDKLGAHHPRWREYLFQRYVDIILKQSVFELGKRESDLTAWRIDDLIDKVTSRVHDAAAEDLEQFLFEENLTGMAAGVSADPGEGSEPEAVA